MAGKRFAFGEDQAPNPKRARSDGYEEAKSPINELPPEMTNKILECAGSENHGIMRYVCPRWRALIDKHYHTYKRGGKRIYKPGTKPSISKREMAQTPELVKWALENGCPGATEDMAKTAAEHGRLDILGQIIDMGYDRAGENVWDVIVNAAIQHDNVKLFLATVALSKTRKRYSAGFSKDTERRIYKYIVKSDNRKLWMLHSNFVFGQDVRVNLIAAHGTFEHIMFRIINGLNCFQTDLVRKIIKAGRFELTKQLLEWGFVPMRKEIDELIWANQLDLLKYVYDQGTFEFTVDETMCMADRFHFDLLEWAISKKMPIYAKYCAEQAALKHRIDILQLVQAYTGYTHNPS